MLLNTWVIYPKAALVTVEITSQTPWIIDPIVSKIGVTNSTIPFQIPTKKSLMAFQTALVVSEIDCQAAKQVSTMPFHRPTKKIFDTIPHLALVVSEIDCQAAEHADLMLSHASDRYDTMEFHKLIKNSLMLSVMMMAITPAMAAMIRPTGPKALKMSDSVGQDLLF
ncbi:hypothetical protein P7H20_26565 [Paenibacillus larvae]|nr:hypothetical protein [Paenibacillus larvae]MDT2277692.1 hypothetical protein [Paenibacillus larvae]